MLNFNTQKLLCDNVESGIIDLDHHIHINANDVIEKVSYYQFEDNFFLFVIQHWRNLVKVYAVIHLQLLILFKYMFVRWNQFKYILFFNTKTSSYNEQRNLTYRHFVSILFNICSDWNRSLFYRIMPLFKPYKFSYSFQYIPKVPVSREKTH